MQEPKEVLDEAKAEKEKKPAEAAQALAAAQRNAQENMNQGKFSVADFREIASAYERYVGAMGEAKPSGRLSAGRFYR